MTKNRVVTDFNSGEAFRARAAEYKRKAAKRVTVEFDSEELATDFAQSVRATGEVILEVGDCGLEVVCAAEVVEGEE